jgi:Putative auto-transporter adhesin, head GIN domain
VRSLLRGGFIIGLLTILSSCSTDTELRAVTGSGVPKSEVRKISTFETIRLAGMGRIVSSPDGPNDLRIQADDNIISEIKTSSDNQSLTIGTSSDVSLRPVTPLLYEAKCQTVSRIELLGGGNIELASCSSSRLDVTLRGSGGVSVKGIASQTVSVEIRGSGTVELEGTTEQLSTKIQGAGNITASSLATKRAKVSIPGNGSVSLAASKELSVDIAGVGNVRYSGDPVVQRNITGIGSVTKVSSTN